LEKAILTDKDHSGYLPYELADIAGHEETKKYL